MRAEPELAEHGLRKPAHFVAIALDGFRLLLPQNEIHRLEPVEDIEPVEGDETHAGWATLNEKRWPVYCLSANLRAMAAIPTSRRICVLLEHADRYFGLACEEVVILKGTQMRVFPLPACMRTPGTPIRALAIHQERVLSVTCKAALAAFGDGRTHA